MQESEAHGRADLQAAPGRHLQMADGLIGVLKVEENLRDPLEIAPPRLGQGDRPRGAVEQAQAQLRFQSGHMPTDDGFGGVETDRRLRKRLQLGDPHEGFDGGEAVHIVAQ